MPTQLRGLSTGEPSLATDSTEGKKAFGEPYECMSLAAIIYLACPIHESLRCALLKHVSDSPTLDI